MIRRLESNEGTKNATYSCKDSERGTQVTFGFSHYFPWSIQRRLPKREYSFSPPDSEFGFETERSRILATSSQKTVLASQCLLHNSDIFVEKRSNRRRKQYSLKRDEHSC